MKLKQIIVYVILFAVLVYAYQTYADKPYCNIEYADNLTVKGKLNPVVYLVTKILAQRKDLKGNDPYKIYIYVHDPDGLQSVQLTIDGKSIPVTIDDPYTFKAEIDGETEFDLHHYQVTAADKKGNTATSDSYIKISNIGGGFI